MPNILNKAGWKLEIFVLVHFCYGYLLLFFILRGPTRASLLIIR